VSASDNNVHAIMPEKSRGLQACPSWSQIGTDINGEAEGDQSGASVSMSHDGTIVAIGALVNSGINGPDSGHVRVHKWNDVSNVWKQFGPDIDGEAEGDWSGYSVSLSMNGRSVAVGARYANGVNGRDTGHVRVFKINDNETEWVQRGADIDGQEIADYFGTSVSMSSTGLTVAIGADKHDVLIGDELVNKNSGHVQVYDWNDTAEAWQKRGENIDGGTAEELSGTSVSISSDGTVVAIGAPNNTNDNGGTKSGQVRIYKWDSPNWVKRGDDINGEAENDRFGYSVDISSNGDVVAIGAKNNSSNGDNSGEVRVYEWSNNKWHQRGNDIHGEAPGDNSGISVSIANEGSVVAVGARYNTPGNNTHEAGHVRIYDLVASTTNLGIFSHWQERGVDIDGDEAEEYSGGAVSMSKDGKFVAIGAIYGNQNGDTSTGNVRVMEARLCPEDANITETIPDEGGSVDTGNTGPDAITLEKTPSTESSSSQRMNYQNGRNTMFVVALMLKYMM